MANFPTLSSGAIAQYPLVTGSVQNTSVIRFLDGADQRFLSQGKQFRKWQLKLELLNDAEVRELEAFFDSQQGAYTSFTFTDPITGLDVPNCRIEASELTTLYKEVDAGSISVWVVETHV
jgi:phage-related protein